MRRKGLGIRLAHAANTMNDQSSMLQMNRGDIFLLKQEQMHGRACLHKDNMEVIKTAISSGVKAPGLEKTMSVKARLREIDAAAHVNAAELHTRSHILSSAKNRNMAHSASDPQLRFDATESILAGPFFPSDAQLERERCAKLKPITGPGAAMRMAMALAQAREVLAKRGLLQEGDLAWAERRVQDAREQEQMKQCCPSTPQPPPPQPRELPLVQDARGLASSLAKTAPSSFSKSASTPALGSRMCGLPRKRPKLPHDVLYPSMKDRCRVVEEHLWRNKDTISNLTKRMH